MKKGLLVLLFCSVFVSCASLGGGSPSWLEQPYDKQYKEQTYLCAVGTGSTRQKAVDAALSSLSQIFNSQVRSVTEVSSLSTATTDVSGNVQFTEAEQMLELGSVTSNTDQIIGAEVVNVYTDELGRVHARVALHRSRTAALYNSKISELDASINQLKVQASKASNILHKYVLMSKTRDYAKQQQALYDQLQVLLNKPQKQVLLSIDRELASIAASISIAVDVHAEDVASQVLQTAFEQGLQKLGLSVGSGVGVLDVSYDVQPIVMDGSPYSYARYTLAVQLKDNSKVYVSYDANDRIAAMAENDAIAKALKQASSAGVDEFFALMLKELGDEN